jgi:RNA polymerase sigma-70 factor (ECF subfamily)
MAVPNEKSNEKNIALELEQTRPYLMRFAMLQLRNETAAEDAVQETMLAALQGASRYAGQSSLKTWLVGILKHKIIDQLRRQKKEPQAFETGTEDFDAMFEEDGHWSEAPADWGRPESTFEQKEFFKVLDLCLEALPANTARVFMMREWLGLDTDEICKELKMTATNCWVVLYRARMGLRACLEKNWFGAQTAKN